MVVVPCHFLTGLDWFLNLFLSFHDQVEVMSIELEEAKVQVAAFQKQCEEFLVVIVQQKREADEQQKVYEKIFFLNFVFLL